MALTAQKFISIELFLLVFVLSRTPANEANEVSTSNDNDSPRALFEEHLNRALDEDLPRQVSTRTQPTFTARSTKGQPAFRASINTMAFNPLLLNVEAKHESRYDTIHTSKFKIKDEQISDFEDSTNIVTVHRGGLVPNSLMPSEPNSSTNDQVAPILSSDAISRSCKSKLSGVISRPRHSRSVNGITERREAWYSDDISKTRNTQAVDFIVERRKARSTNVISKPRNTQAVDFIVEIRKARSTNVISKPRNTQAVGFIVERRKVRSPNVIPRKTQTVDFTAEARYTPFSELISDPRNPRSVDVITGTRKARSSNVITLSRNIRSLLHGHGVSCSTWDHHRKTCQMDKCPMGRFQCRTGMCIPFENICDQQPNTLSCNKITDPTDHCGHFDCPKDYFRCADGHCLHYVAVCDEVNDCAEGDDEAHCGHPECREDDQVDCGNGKCIPIALKCDRYDHCGNAKDEINCGVYMEGRQYSNCDHTVVSYVHPYDFEYCSFYCPEECKCTIGLIDCSSPTFTFSGKFEKRDIWPFEEMDSQRATPITKLEIPLSRMFGFVLSNSLLRMVPVSVFRYTPLLQTLDLSHNLITHLKYSDFAGLFRLSLLDLSSNRIETIEDFTFKGLRVFHLLLENNSIEHFGPDMYGGMAADGVIRTDALKLCCIKPSHLPAQNCFPGFDPFSSCDHLMRSFHFRILLWIIGGLALLGNLGVTIKRLIYARQSKRKCYDLFVLNIHLSDFLMGVYLLIIAIADETFRGRYSNEDERWRGGFMCNLAGILSVISNESSPMFALLITVDRYFGIKYPFGERRVSFCVAVALTTCAWVLSIFLAIVPLIFSDYFQGKFYSNSVVCLSIPLSTQLMVGWQYATGLYCGLNSVLFILIVGGQVAIFREISSAKSKTVSSSQVNEMKVAKSLMFIVLTDFVCWCPVCILIVMSLAGVNMPLDVYPWVVTLVLPVNAALNPILYTLTIREPRGTRR